MYDDILKYLNENSNITFEFSSMFGRFMSKGVSIDIPSAKNMVANGAMLQVKNRKASTTTYVHISSCTLFGMICLDLYSNDSSRCLTIEFVDSIIEDSDIYISMSEHVMVSKIKISNTNASFNFTDCLFSPYYTVDFQNSIIDCCDVFLGDINFKGVVCPVIVYSDNDFEIIYNNKRYFNIHMNDLFRDLKNSNLI